MPITYASNHSSVSQSSVAEAGQRVESTAGGQALTPTIGSKRILVTVTDDAVSPGAHTTKILPGGEYDYEIEIPKQVFDGEKYRGVDGELHSTTFARNLAHELYHIDEWEREAPADERMSERFADWVTNEFGEIANSGEGSFPDGSNGSPDMGGGSGGSPGSPGGLGGPALPPPGGGPGNQGSPLVLDLGYDGIDLQALGDNGTYFDLRGNGQAVLTGWVAPQDGLLALDINQNGTIDNITELFGNITTDGFSLLSAHDSNSDKVINVSDSVFGDLLVWTDTNSDGISQEGELHTLASLDITSINLTSTRLGNQEIEGNLITHESSFTMDDVEHTIVDAWFSYDLGNTRNIEEYDLDIRAVFLPTLRGYGDIKDLNISASLDYGSDPDTIMERLISLAEDFSYADVLTDWSAYESAVDELLLAWAGVDTVSTTGRGSYVNGQHLAFYEQFTGQSFLQYGKSNPLPEAGEFIEAIYEHIRTVFAMHIITQAAGTEIFESPAYNLHTGGIWGDLDLVQDGIDAVKDAAIGATEPGEVWTRFAQFIGYTKGLDNLTSGELEALDDAVYATGESGLADWQDVVSLMIATLGPIIDSSDDWGSFEIYYDNNIDGTSGDDSITDTNAGGNHNNEFAGLDGNDTIDASDGHDKIRGGAGNDILIGGAGDDFLLGGTGDDVYRYDSGNDTISEVGGSGYDELHILSSTGLTSANVTDLYRYNDELLLLLSTGSYITIDGYGDSDARIEKIIFDSNSSVIDLAAILEEKYYGTVGVDDITVEGTSSQTMLVYGYAANDTITADGAAAKFYGGDGYDMLIGDYLPDFLYGENGDDYLDGADGNDTLTGGSGNDTLVGGDDADLLYGNSGNDRLDGEAGNDVLEGAAGDDVYVFGTGYGQDTAYDFITTSASDNDEVRLLSGILTTDIIVGRASDSSITLTIDGTSDVLTLKKQEFYASDTAQIEKVVFADGTTWTATDLVLKALDTQSTSGNDTIFGFEQRDDVIEGGAGDDTINGIGGDDTYIFNLGDGQDVISDNSGTDQLVFGAGIDTTDVVVTRGTNDSIVLSITGTSDTVTFDKQEYYSVNVNRIDEVVFDDSTVWNAADLREMAIASQVTSGNDTVTAFLTNDEIMGGTGNDTLKGRDGNDTYLYNLGDGQDTFEDTQGTDLIKMGAGIVSGDISLSRTGDDLLISISAAPSSSILIKNHYASSSKVIEKIVFNDTSELSILPQIVGTSGNDTLSGTSAADLIYGRQGNDTINAGSGNDEVYGEDGDDTINGSNGTDLLYGNAGADIIDGGDAVDTIEGNDGDDTLYGQAGNDILSGNAGADIIWGGNDADSIEGNDGDDTLYGESGSDTLSGGLGNDTIDGGSGTDTLTYAASLTAVNVNLTTATATGEGTDTLTSLEHVIGSAFDDIIIGNSSANLLVGGEGNDLLIGNDGDDTMEGGLGDDTYGVIYAQEEDYITDIGGYDILSFTDSTTSENLDFFTENHDSGAVADDVKVDFNNTSLHEVVVYNQVSTTLTDRQIEEIRFSDGFSLNFSRYGTTQWVQVGNSTTTQDESSAVQARTIIGGTNANTITGTAYADQIHADAGNDTVDGGAGNDWLHGGTGADAVNGGSGDDVIFGGTGNDTLDGGSDTDTVRYSGATSAVTVNISTGSATGEGTDTLSNFENITGSGYNDTLTGNALANVLEGGIGDDLLAGAGSDDSYIYSSEDDEDTITDSGGTDEIRFGEGIVLGDLTFSFDGDDLVLDTDGSGDNTITITDFALASANRVEILRFFDNSIYSLNPVITSNGGNSTASENVAEGVTSVTTVAASGGLDTLTYSITGGADSAKFSINSATGTLSFASAQNFESPTDSGSNNIYDVQVSVSDGTLTDIQDIAVTITNVNEAPVISSNGGSSTASTSISENSTTVTTVTASDVDAGTTLAYSISGGADSAKFNINSSTGALTFATAPNYESPTDSGSNNIYDVQVQVSDGTLTDVQDIAVTVTNVNEAPVLTSNGGGSTASTSVAEGSTAVTTVVSTDPDAGATKTYSISGGADSAKFTINSSTGVLAFVTAPNHYSPTDSGTNNVYDVQVQVSDGTLTDVQDIAVTVTSTNTAPDANNDAVSQTYALAITGNVLSDNGSGADSDPNGDTITVVESSVTSTGGRAVTLSSNGNFTFTSSSDLIGTDTFTYTISDGRGGTDTATATITINAPSGAIVGTSGGETVSGTSGADTVIALAGNDTVNAGDGDDLIYGGSGDDSLNGGNGFDMVSYVLAGAAVTVNLATGSATGEGTDTLSGINGVYGSAYADTITGTSGGDTLVSGAGNDDVTGADGNDTIETGDGADTIHGDAGLDIIDAGAGDDVIYGGANSDTIHGGDGNDSIYAEDGNDIIYGDAGNDTIAGGNNNDIIYGGTGNDTIDGSGSNDTVDYSLDTAGVTVNLSTGTATDGGGGTDMLSNIERVTGSAYADTLTGSNASNIILGAAGNDIIYGLDGDDTIEGGTGNDTIDGGVGADTIDAGDGDDTVHGGDTSDVIYGGIGNDTIYGDGGNDMLHGDAGNDTIYGGDNSDTIFGGSGNDVFYGGGSTDTIDYSADTAGVTVNLSSGTATDGSGGSDTFSDIERATGSAYADTLTGNSGSNTLTGGAGNDSLVGGAGNDTIDGGDNNDMIYGQDGTDALTGGAGADTFVFESATAYNNVDTISDFSTASSDALNLVSLLTAYDELTEAITDYVQITTSGSNSLLSVDRDGAASTYGFTQIATITGVTGLTDEAALVTSGNLVVT